MEIEKLDRRTRRTRRLLSEALLNLLMEKGYEAITIEEITKRADLNRATFYLHYKSKEELLVASLEAQFDELVNRLGVLDPHLPAWKHDIAELMAFRYVAEHASLYKMLLSEKGMGYVMNRIIEYIAQYSMKEMIAYLPDWQGKVPAEIIARHIAGSLFALLSWWISNDMPYTPEYMAAITHELCTEGTLNLLP